MRVNDIVKVDDSSYSMVLTNGILKHVCVVGGVFQQRRWRVLSVSGMYPTDKSNTVSRDNDTMLVDMKDPDFVLFTQKRFCCVVTPAALPEKQKELLEVVVPHGIKGVYLTFEKQGGNS